MTLLTLTKLEWHKIFQLHSSHVIAYNNHFIIMTKCKIATHEWMRVVRIHH